VGVCMGVVVLGDGRMNERRMRKRRAKLYSCLLDHGSFYLEMMVQGAEFRMPALLGFALVAGCVGVGLPQGIRGAQGG
jgi:hypothetical protein